MSCTTQQCQLTHTVAHTQHSQRHSHSYAHFGLCCEFVLNSMHYAPQQRCHNGAVATTLRCSFSCQRKMRVIMHRRRFISSLCSYPLFWRPFTSYLLSLCSNWSMHCKCLECCKRLTQPKTNTAQTNKRNKTGRVISTDSRKIIQMQ